jgi:hypothetical protein
MEHKKYGDQISSVSNRISLGRKKGNIFTLYYRNLFLSFLTRLLSLMIFNPNFANICL